MTERAAMVVGVGSQTGLGAALARRFAREGLRVFIVGRTTERLNVVAEDIQNSGGIAEPVVADATRESDVIALLDQAVSTAALELVVYNAGGISIGSSLDATSALFENTWRQNALGGFLVGREAIRRMLPRRKGTVIFTGATASLRARPPFTEFASAKAALRAVAQGLAREFAPRGIHVAHVVIDGVIRGEHGQNNFADIVKAKGEDGLLEADAIADSYWVLHSQPRSAWTHELDLRPFKEPF